MTSDIQWRRIHSNRHGGHNEGEQPGPCPVGLPSLVRTCPLAVILLVAICFLWRGGKGVSNNLVCLWWSLVGLSQRLHVIVCATLSVPFAI